MRGSEVASSYVMRGILGVAVATTLQWRTVCSCKQTSLFQATCDHIYRSSSVREELRQLIHEGSVENALRYLGEFSEDVSMTSDTLLSSELEEAPDVLARIAVVFNKFEKWYIAQKAPQKVTMHEPWDWYPKARFMRRRFIYHYGPTNSGKTHAALEALVKAKSGVYCAPLKALAAQVWKRIDMSVPCDLLIGDERRFGGGAEHVSCTVEMTPIDYQVNVGVIDEVQMIADRERGWAWTRALLGLPAREIHLCGEERAIPLIRNLLYKTYELQRLELVPHKRLVPLEVSPSLCGDLRRLENGDCLVCFSRKTILSMKKRLESFPGVVSHFIYGLMPFSVREAQAAAFNEGVQEFIKGNTTNRHILISTDAIAYGLNMSIERIVFAAMRKFDGRQMVSLPHASIVQIVGRAGRFGVARSKAVGYCTTLHSDDFALLNNAVNSRLPLLQKAGLLPTADILELYIRLRGAAIRGKKKRELTCAVDESHVTFYETLKEFTYGCQASDVLFPCDVSRSLLQVARELETVSDLTLSDRIMFCYVPLSDHSKETYVLLRLFAQDHAAGRHVPLRVNERFEVLMKEWEILCEHADARGVQRILTGMEHVYRQTEMYCWLAWRFGKTFVHLEMASTLREKVATKIDLLLRSL